MSDIVKSLETLVKTLEAGNYNVAPDKLVQGSALQVENLESVMQNVTFDDSDIKLQKMFKISKTKSLLVQFNRQLSYGHFGGSAVREGQIGDIDVGDYVRATVPMCYYSNVRRTTLQSNLIDSVDGKKAEDREMENSAKKLAADIEFDMFKGRADFSNNGVFDGNPIVMADMPNMLGVDSQIRSSDLMVNTQDLMFASFGSNKSVVLHKGGSLDQLIIQDASLRQRMNFGKSDSMIVDPVALASFNKQVMQSGTNSLQRIVLAGSAQDAVGADIRRQWVTGGTVALEDSRFLSAKTSPLRPTFGAPSAPGSVSGVAAGSDSSIPAGSYVYVVTCVNERGEGAGKASSSISVAAGQHVTLTIDVSGISSPVSYCEVYRGSSASSAVFIGKVKNDGSGSITFIDLGNKIAEGTAGYLLEKDTWGVHELAPFSRLKLAVSELSTPEASFRFLTLAGYQPRKNVIIDQIK